MVGDQGERVAATEFHYLEHGPEPGTVPEPNSRVVFEVLELGARVLAAEQQLEHAEAELEKARQAASKYALQNRQNGATLVGFCFPPGSFPQKAADRVREW